MCVDYRRVVMRMLLCSDHAFFVGADERDGQNDAPQSLSNDGSVSTQKGGSW
jgi:hypothetical protein